MAKKHKASLLTQNLTYFIVCVISLIMIGGSFLLRVNFGEEATADQKVIEYSYQNESSDPMKRNHFRRVKITINNVVSLMKVDTKDMRFSIFRSGEMGDKNLQTGKVFAIVLEDMAKFKSVIFDYNRCVVEKETSTDIIIFLFKRYESDLALKVMIVNINRQTDKISVMGRELSAEDIWTNDLTNGDLLRNHQVALDKGYLRLLMEGHEGGD